MACISGTVANDGSPVIFPYFPRKTLLNEPRIRPLGEAIPKIQRSLCIDRAPSRGLLNNIITGVNILFWLPNNQNNIIASGIHGQGICVGSNGFEKVQ